MTNTEFHDSCSPCQVRTGTPMYPAVFLEYFCIVLFCFVFTNTTYLCFTIFFILLHNYNWSWPKFLTILQVSVVVVVVLIHMVASKILPHSIYEYYYVLNSHTFLSKTGEKNTLVLFLFAKINIHLNNYAKLL